MEAEPFILLTVDTVDVLGGRDGPPQEERGRGGAREP
jgi:hypothetical protein